MASAIRATASKVASVPGRTIVWFRNDQRLIDNPIVHEAAKLKAPVLCVYCFDPRHYETTEYGSSKTDSYRCKFLVESINDLRSNLRGIDSDLLVSYGRPEDLLPQLCKEDGGKNVVVVQHEDAWEELQVEKAVEKAINAQGATMRKFNGATMYHPDDIPFAANFKDIPDGFTPFKKKVEYHCEVRKLLPTPKKGSLPPTQKDLDVISDKCSFDFIPSETMLGLEEGAFEEAGNAFNNGGVLDFKGGETAGKNRLQYWMFDQDKLKEYFEIRNGMLGEGYSSKFSPWLATGNLSPRWIYHECKRYEEERGIANKSTYWMVFELIWRDFFHFLLPKYGRRTFYSGGMKGIRTPWNVKRERVQRWKTGTTGMPLVDANMRELAATGWMSNRGRQNVASYLVVDMGVDWRIGADHFESLLLDHDVYSNYGNWNSAAGLTGGRLNRFNIVKQSRDYDPKGDYIRHWIPELAKVPAPLIFEPWKMTKSQQEEYGVDIGTTYPRPLPLGQPLQRGGGGGGNNNGKGRNRGGNGRGRGGNNNQRNRNNRNDNDNRNRGRSGKNQKGSDVPDWFVKANRHVPPTHA